MGPWYSTVYEVLRVAWASNTPIALRAEVRDSCRVLTSQVTRAIDAAVRAERDRMTPRITEKWVRRYNDAVEETKVLQRRLLAVHDTPFFAPLSVPRLALRHGVPGWTLVQIEDMPSHSSAFRSRNHPTVVHVDSCRSLSDPQPSPRMALDDAMTKITSYRDGLTVLKVQED